MADMNNNKHTITPSAAHLSPSMTNNTMTLTKPSMRSSMPEPRRVNIKEILADPVLSAELVEGATDFICKMEGIRPSFGSSIAENAYKANKAGGLALALTSISDAWAAEINGAPRAGFTGGVQTCIDALREIAEDIKDV